MQTNDIICRYIIYVILSIHNVRRSTYTHAYTICSYTGNRDVTRHPITLLLSSVVVVVHMLRDTQFSFGHRLNLMWNLYSTLSTIPILYNENFIRNKFFSWSSSDCKYIFFCIYSLLVVYIFLFLFLKSCHTKECGKCTKCNTPDITVLHTVRKWVPTTDLQYY